MTLVRRRTRSRVRLHRTMIKKEVSNMKPNYICVNGHKFNEPLFGESPGWPLRGPVHACPVCYTQDFRRYPSLDELKKLEPKPKTRVTKPGRAIQGSTMVQFKCELCSCEFESPISECSLSIVDYIHIIPVANHKCPNKFCGVECEETIGVLNIFGDQHE